jgi:hypothetical protein
MWRRRLLLAVVCGLLYFAIGRDLIALGRAKKDTMVMEVRHDAHGLAKDVERLVEAGRLQTASESTSPLAFMSAAALAGREDPADVDAWLCDEPVEFRSRAE